jgi:outer membrane receptor protein involved in Fe transport
VRYIDDAGQPFQSVSAAPYNAGGLFITAAAFASDAVTIGPRVTINAGVRYDHSEVISQDLPAVDEACRETNATVRGLGTLYTWNVVSRIEAEGRRISADLHLSDALCRFCTAPRTGPL